jgi:hypothetical protein
VGPPDLHAGYEPELVAIGDDVTVGESGTPPSGSPEVGPAAVVREARTLLEQRLTKFVHQLREEPLLLVVQRQGAVANELDVVICETATVKVGRSLFP